MGGKVYIVGAGPGDPKLLTLGGLEALREAEVVVYDRLVGQGVLDLIPKSAQRVYAGKTAGDDEGAMIQEKINALMLEGARAGKTVVRLKGGDPFVFARGGEELEFLLGHGVDVEVVPGVTSAFSVPAYAGIPPTHRGYSSSVTVVTGHQVATTRPGAAGVDWSKIAGGSETIIILMGAQKLAEIARTLIGAGVSGSTPMAAIRWGTTERQEMLLVTIAEAAAGQRRWRRHLGPPSVIVVGRTVALAGRLSWWKAGGGGGAVVRASPGFRAIVGDAGLPPGWRVEGRGERRGQLPTLGERGAACEVRAEPEAGEKMSPGPRASSLPQSRARSTPGGSSPSPSGRCRDSLSCL